MPANKRSAATEKELRVKVKKLRAKLEQADAKARRWKSKADRLKQAAAESQARVKQLSKRLDTASVATEPRRSRDPERATKRAPDETRSTTDAAPPAVTPDESWTVVQLRAEARSRGLVGLSGKSKADLLAALS